MTSEETPGETPEGTLGETLEGALGGTPERTLGGTLARTPGAPPATLGQKPAPLRVAPSGRPSGQRGGTASNKQRAKGNKRQFAAAFGPKSAKGSRRTDYAQQKLGVK